MPTLYELTDRYAELWRLADASEDGILDPDLCDLIDQNEDDIKTKVNGYGKVIRNLEANAACCKMEEARLAARRKAAENAIKRIKESLQFGMETLGTDSIKTDLFTATIQNNPPAVQVKDEALIPADYFEPQPPKLLKEKLSVDLKAGAAILGAELTRGRSLRLR